MSEDKKLLKQIRINLFKGDAIDEKVFKILQDKSNIKSYILDQILDESKLSSYQNLDKKIDDINASFHTVLKIIDKLSDLEDRLMNIETILLDSKNQKGSGHEKEQVDLSGY